MSRHHGLSLAFVALVVVGAMAPSPVVGAASPSPNPGADPMAPSFFTGTASVEGACQIARPPSTVIDGVRRTRGEGWGCLRWETDDPRFTGVSKNVYDTDQYLALSDMATPRLGSIVAGRERIENAAGAWEGTWTDLAVGSFNEVAGWFEGRGAYEGLAAYVVITDALGSAKVWGVITPGRLEPPEAFVGE